MKLKVYLERNESDPSLKAPKKWWDAMEKDVKKRNPKLDDEAVGKIVGDIWYNKLDDKKRKELKSKEGKSYAKAK